MKKLLSTLLILCFALNSQAQNDTDEKKFHLGLLTVSKLNWFTAESKNLSGDGVNAGISLGLSFDQFFAKNYAFSVELLHYSGSYSVMADSLSQKSNRFGDVGIKYKERAFQIPISIKLRTGEIGYWRYFGQIGIAPLINYRSIRADYSNTGVFGSNPDDAIDRFVNENENDFDYADASIVSDDNRRYFLEEDNVSALRVPLMVSAGAEWNLSGSTSIIMGIRYEYGLLNVMKAEGSVGRINSFGIMAGVRF
ncbi:MAG: PorT family protein [Bacteroidetes bacterium]|nr:MAG: PorT family protein [Bacteroidota bacterium]